MPSLMMQQLSEAQNHHCAYCGVIMTYDRNKETSVTKDHVIPRVRKGITEWENLVAACAKCNSGRGHIDAYVFFHLGEVERCEYEQLVAWAKVDRVVAFELLEARQRLEEKEFAAAWKIYKKLLG
jgi:hypothetical protein